MHILCTICSDLIDQAENIYVTKCGHIFHHQCLAQWIERSKTCPQCRNKVTDKCMFRLFPTVSNESNSEDAATLQSRLDDAQLQLRQQRVKSKEKEDKLTAATADLKRQDDLLRSYERRLVSFDSKVLALQEQLEYANAQNKDRQKIVDENELFRKHLALLRDMQKVLTASDAEVERVVASYSDVKTVATFATALKKALCDSETKMFDFRDKMYAAKQMLALEKKKVEILTSKLRKLQVRVQAAHEKSRDESYTLYKRHSPPRNYEDGDNTSFMNIGTDDSWVHGDLNQERNKRAAWLNVLAPRVTKTNPPRSDAEAEAVEAEAAEAKAVIDQLGLGSFQCKIKNIFIKRMRPNETYDKSEKKKASEAHKNKNAADLQMDVVLMKEDGLVENIEKSDSPYLKLQQGSVLSLTALQRKPLKLPENAQKSEQGYLNAVKNAKQKRIGEQSNAASTKHSIFNKKELRVTLGPNDTIPTGSGISYDGLGGHSKPDVFPVPNTSSVQSRIPKVSAKHKLKRPNPSGSQDIEKMLKKVKNN